MPNFDFSFAENQEQQMRTTFMKQDANQTKKDFSRKQSSDLKQRQLAELE